MLQHLIRAYADAYTIAITPSVRHVRDHEARNRDAERETPNENVRGRGWRALLSAFL
jgi:hypothetical protein